MSRFVIASYDTEHRDKKSLQPRFVGEAFVVRVPDSFFAAFTRKKSQCTDHEGDSLVRHFNTHFARENLSRKSIQRWRAREKISPPLSSIAFFCCTAQTNNVISIALHMDRGAKKWPIPELNPVTSFLIERKLHLARSLVADGCNRLHGERPKGMGFLFLARTVEMMRGRG